MNKITRFNENLMYCSIQKYDTIFSIFKKESHSRNLTEISLEQPIRIVSALRSIYKSISRRLYVHCIAKGVV